MAFKALGKQGKKKTKNVIPRIYILLIQHDLFFNQWCIGFFFSLTNCEGSGKFVIKEKYVKNKSQYYVSVGDTGVTSPRIISIHFLTIIF